MHEPKNIINEFVSKIIELNKTNPGIWIITTNIIKDSRYTLILDNTIIISVYELSEKNLIILYRALKALKGAHGIQKVINKHEFLIVRFYSKEIINYFINSDLWKLYELLEILNQFFYLKKSVIENNILEVVTKNDVYIFKILNSNYILANNINNKDEIILEYYYARSLFVLEILDKLKICKK